MSAPADNRIVELSWSWHSTAPNDAELRVTVPSISSPFRD